MFKNKTVLFILVMLIGSALLLFPKEFGVMLVFLIITGGITVIISNQEKNNLN